MAAAVYALGMIMGNSVLTLILQVFLGVAIYGAGAVVYFFKTKDTMIIGIYENKIKKLFKRKA